MILILFLMSLAAPTQAAEARKLLDALAPPLKDPAHSQIEWESGQSKGVGHFRRGQAWILEQTFAKGGQVTVWDGKGSLQHMKTQNVFWRDRREPADMLLSHGGGLAEIHYSGNSDRLLKDAKQVLVKKEKLDDVECSHVVIVRKATAVNAADFELHFWIGPDQSLKKYVRKSTLQGKTYETAFTYKVVDPPTTTEESFTYTPPADARDLRGR